MKIIQIIPELEIGGVERHVIDLSNELSSRGQNIAVISFGGRMESQLSQKVKTIHMPVHKKNIYTIFKCAGKIAEFAKKNNYEVIHAHSRIPAWIAYLAAKKAQIPFIVTAHAEFNTKTHWIYKPYREAEKVICVSEAVREAMKNCFYANTQVVLNGLNKPAVRWKKQNGITKFLFVGRLAESKGVQDVLRALPENYDWTFDIIGDGKYKEELKKLIKDKGFEERVFFRGYSDNPDEYMANSSCLLFPSHEEGFGLVLARAAQIGMPFIASDIKAFAELCGNKKGLIHVGDINALREAIIKFLKSGETDSKLPLENIPTLARQVDENERIYREVIERGFVNGDK